MKDKTVLTHILKGLTPYTRENIALAYKPSLFFNELERMSAKQHKKKLSRSTIKTTYYRAKKSGYIVQDTDGRPLLSDKGHKLLAKYNPKKLPNAKLLVTYDIPEDQRHKRKELRQLLFILKFKLVQRSVWISEYDGKKILKDEINRLGLNDAVNIYEAHKI